MTRPAPLIWKKDARGGEVAWKAYRHYDGPRSPMVAFVVWGCGWQWEFMGISTKWLLRQPDQGYTTAAGAKRAANEVWDRFCRKNLLVSE